jgi:hypothetical protein
VASDGAYELIQEALTNRTLRVRLSQDRSSAELADSANKKGYVLSEKDAKKILAGALLTDESLNEEQKQKLVGGLKWDYLDRVEAALDGDYRLLEDRETWERTRDFYEYVYQGEPE